MDKDIAELKKKKGNILGGPINNKLKIKSNITIKSGGVAIMHFVWWGAI